MTHPGLSRIPPIRVVSLIAMQQASQRVQGIQPRHQTSIVQVGNRVAASQTEADLPLSISEPTTNDINDVVANAQSAFDSGIWSRASALHRSKVLSKLAHLLEEQLPRLAEIETMQVGRTIREMRAQLGRLPEWL